MQRVTRCRIGETAGRVLVEARVGTLCRRIMRLLGWYWASSAAARLCAASERQQRVIVKRILATGR
jgi:hypothetical protein